MSKSDDVLSYIVKALVKERYENNMDELKKSTKEVYKIFKDEYGEKLSDKEGFAFGYAFGYTEAYLDSIKTILKDDNANSQIIPEAKIKTIEKEIGISLKKHIDEIIDAITNL